MEAKICDTLDVIDGFIKGKLIVTSTITDRVNIGHSASERWKAEFCNLISLGTRYSSQNANDTFFRFLSIIDCKFPPTAINKIIFCSKF